MFTLIKNSWGFLIFFVSLSSNSGRHNSATKDFSSARDKRIEILFYEESFDRLHSHHAIMAIYCGGSRGRVPPPHQSWRFFGTEILTSTGLDCISLFNWPRNYHMQPRLEVTATLLYLPTFSESNASDFHLVMTGFPMIFRRLPNFTENVRRCSDNI